MANAIKIISSTIRESVFFFAMPLQVSVILPHRAKNVDQFTVGNGRAAMQHIRRDNGKQTRLKHLRVAVYGEFKFAGNGKGALLVYMLVQRYRTAGLYLDKVDGIGIGMDQFGEKARRNFFGWDVGKVTKDGSVHN